MSGYAAKVTIESSRFVDTTGWALKGYDVRNEKEYILLEFDAEWKTMTASSVSSSYYFKTTTTLEDLEFYDVDTDKARGDQESFKLALDGKVLSKLVSGSIIPKNSTLTLTEKWGNNDYHYLELVAPGRKFKIDLLDNERPPKSPDISILGEIPAFEFIDSVKRLTKISDTAGATTVPALAALDITVDSENEKLRIMATDRYALSEITMPFTENTESTVDTARYTPQGNTNVEVLLHASNAALLTRDVPLDGQVQVGFDSDDRVALQFDDGRVACMNTVDAEATPYGDFLTAERDEDFVIVDFRELENAIKISNALSWDSDEQTILFGKEKLTVSSAHNTSSINVAYDDDIESGVSEELTVSISNSVITKAFNAVGTKKVRVGWVSGSSYFTLKPILDSGEEQEEVFSLFVPVIRED